MERHELYTLNVEVPNHDGKRTFPLEIGYSVKYSGGDHWEDGVIGIESIRPQSGSLPTYAKEWLWSRDGITEIKRELNRKLASFP